MKKLAFLTMFLLCGMPAQYAAAAPQESACLRKCLYDLVETYLAALKKRDPSTLPLMSDVRNTEDGRAMPVGDGLWNTITSVDTYRNYFADPLHGQVAAMVTIKENGIPMLITVRLKAPNGRISEIETIAARSSSNFDLPPPDPVWQRAEPKGKRLTREQLIANITGYMKAISTTDTSDVSFDDKECYRMENGWVTVRPPGKALNLATIPGKPVGSWFEALHSSLELGCTAQARTKVYSFITGYANERFPIVDVENQVVYTVFNFLHTGAVTEISMPDGKKYPVLKSQLQPNDTILGEAFKFRDGKIIRIEAVFRLAPYHYDTGWN